MTFGKGKEKKGERWKVCFLLRVPLFVSCEAWKRRQAKGLFCLGSASFALPIVILSGEGQILVLLLVVLYVEGQFFTLIFVLLSGERQILVLPLVVLSVEGQF